VQRVVSTSFSISFLFRLDSLLIPFSRLFGKRTSSSRVKCKIPIDNESRVPCPRRWIFDRTYQRDTIYSTYKIMRRPRRFHAWRVRNLRNTTYQGRTTGVEREIMHERVRPCWKDCQDNASFSQKVLSRHLLHSIKAHSIVIVRYTSTYWHCCKHTALMNIWKVL